MTSLDDELELRVSFLIGDEVARIAPDADLHELALALTANDVGALVVGDGPRPEGIVSERDVVHALAERRDPEATRTRDIAQTNLIWCDVDSRVADVAREMQQRYVRHILVEDDGRLVGVVSARDLIGALTSSEAFFESD
jgi:CBS domain-containing protein